MAANKREQARGREPALVPAASVNISEPALELRGVVGRFPTGMIDRKLPIGSEPSGSHCRASCCRHIQHVKARFSDCFGPQVLLLDWRQQNRKFFTEAISRVSPRL